MLIKESDMMNYFLAYFLYPLFFNHSSRVFSCSFTISFILGSSSTIPLNRSSHSSGNSSTSQGITAAPPTTWFTFCARMIRINRSSPVRPFRAISSRADVNLFLR